MTTTNLSEVLKRADAYQRPAVPDHVLEIETKLKAYLIEMYGKKTSPKYDAGVEPLSVGITVRLNDANQRGGIGWQSVNVQLDQTGLAKVSSSVLSQMASSGASWMPEKNIDFIDVSLNTVDDAVVSLLSAMKQVSSVFAEKIAKHLSLDRGPEIRKMGPSTWS